MFVIDRVELQPIKHVTQRWHLDDRLTIVFEQAPYSVEHAVEIRHMGQNVVGMNYVGAAALAGETRGKIAPEELLDRVDAALVAGDACDVTSGFDAEHSYSTRAIVL